MKKGGACKRYNVRALPSILVGLIIRYTPDTHRSSGPYPYEFLLRFDELLLLALCKASFRGLHANVTRDKCRVES